MTVRLWKPGQPCPPLRRLVQVVRSLVLPLLRLEGHGRLMTATRHPKETP